MKKNNLSLARWISAEKRPLSADVVYPWHTFPAALIRPPLAEVPDDAALFYAEYPVKIGEHAEMTVAQNGVYAVWLNGHRVSLPNGEKSTDISSYIQEDKTISIVAAVSQKWLDGTYNTDQATFASFFLTENNVSRTVVPKFNWFGSLPNAIRQTELLRGDFSQHKPMPDDGGLPLFRKTFTVHELGKVRRATLDATALGIYDVFLNGHRLGRKEGDRIEYDEFKPGWTDYSKRVQYNTFDVLTDLQNGENTLIACVAPGWWNGGIANGTYGDTHIAFLASLDMATDTETVTVTTDSSWQSSYQSSFRSADIWNGEIYDANLPAPALLSLRPELAEWHCVTEETHDVEISPFSAEPVRIRPALTQKPISVTVYRGADDNGTEYGEIHTLRNETGGEWKLNPGEIAVVDFGQNMTGVPSLSVLGTKGTTVQLRTGEMCNDTGLFLHGNDGPKGSVYSNNLRAAKSKAYYVLCGDGWESYAPTYTFFGYRYLEIAASAPITVRELKALVIGSDIRETGHIETSDARVNQLLSNILWGQRSNYLSIPSDCPQRDERLGWTGDTQAFCRTASYNADVRAFLTKWLRDARDSQADDGQYPDCVPRTRLFGEGAAGWGDAGVIVCHALYEMFGDTDVIREHFASMEAYMDWLATRGFSGPKAVYCDWLAVDWTDGEYISVAYYACDAKRMAEMANAIGNKERAAHYTKLFEDIRRHFRSRYCDKDGCLNKNLTQQTVYLLALHFDLLNAHGREDAVRRLKVNIRDNGGKLTTGFLGTSVLCLTLAEIGEMSLAYSLLLQTDRPSWLYSVLHGATTIWERWDSYTPEHGFFVYGMDSSFNHYSYGAIAEWMYRHVAGIQSSISAPGFAHPVIAPKPDFRKPEEIPVGQTPLTFVKASFDSPVGLIRSAWDTHSGLCCEIEVPVPSTICLPRPPSGEIFSVNGIQHRYDEYPTDEYGSAIIEVAAGTYEFSAQ